MSTNQEAMAENQNKDSDISSASPQTNEDLDSFTSKSIPVELTECQRVALEKVNKYACSRSNDSQEIEHLRVKLGSLENGKYESTVDGTLAALRQFLAIEVPIIIRVHIKSLIPKIQNDTHYRNLFEVGWGSAGIDTGHRAKMESVLFQKAYNNATAFERPKYGCLNVALIAAGTQQATQYGDAYFTVKDETVRWRTSLTVGDSFNVRGNTATLNHCNHLLNQLRPEELQEIIDVALTGKCWTEGRLQKSFREIQIHGPIQFARDITSLHVPREYEKNLKLLAKLQMFCRKNGCELIFFDPVTANQKFKEKLE